MTSVVVMGIYEKQIPYELRAIYLYFVLMMLACVAALMCVYACSCYRRYREELSENRKETSVLDDDERDFPVPLDDADW